MLSTIIAEKPITDIVLYGDTRPIHAEAIKLAKALDLRVHVFEEGYLRPYWVNYQRGGANGNSRLMGMTVAQMQKVLRKAKIDHTEAPPIGTISGNMPITVLSIICRYC